MANEIAIKEESAIALSEKFDLDELIKPLQKEIFLFDTFIAGTMKLTDTSVIEKLREGDKLFFQREPENRYDDNAIMVLNSEKVKIGYVPEKDNVIFSRLMDAGKMLTGKVTEIKMKSGYTQVAIGIYLVDF